MKVYLILSALFFIIGCSNSEVTTKNQKLEGLSMETAIVVGAPGGPASQKDWIAKHYPGYRLKLQALVGKAGRKYDQITISKHGVNKTLYFELNQDYLKNLISEEKSSDKH